MKSIYPSPFLLNSQENAEILHLEVGMCEIRYDPIVGFWGVMNQPCLEIIGASLDKSQVSFLFLPVHVSQFIPSFSTKQILNSVKEIKSFFNTYQNIQLCMIIY